MSSPRSSPSLRDGSADLGVCIHEARFTWREQGLALVEDLGETWERATGAPLPLGGLVARTDLGEELTRSVARAVADSVRWAREHRDACLPTMRRHAQEADDAVLWGHVELYVNDWTQDLGREGRRALRTLDAETAERGLGGGRPDAGLSFFEE